MGETPLIDSSDSMASKNSSSSTPVRSSVGWSKTDGTAIPPNKLVKQLLEAGNQWCQTGLRILDGLV